MKPIHPGQFIRKWLELNGVTRNALADAIYTDWSRLNKIVKGQKDITPEMAVRLALAMNIPPEILAVQQARYSVSQVRTEKFKDIFKIGKGKLPTQEHLQELSSEANALEEPRQAP